MSIISEVLDVGKFIANQINDIKERKEFEDKLLRLSKSFAESVQNTSDLAKEANELKEENKSLREQMRNLLAEKANNYQRRNP